jgi:hypothetical protein
MFRWLSGLPQSLYESGNGQRGVVTTELRLGDPGMQSQLREGAKWGAKIDDGSKRFVLCCAFAVASALRAPPRGRAGTSATPSATILTAARARRALRVPVLPTISWYVGYRSCDGIDANSKAELCGFVQISLRDGSDPAAKFVASVKGSGQSTTFGQGVRVTVTALQNMPQKLFCGTVRVRIRIDRS